LARAPSALIFSSRTMPRLKRARNYRTLAPRVKQTQKTADAMVAQRRASYVASSRGRPQRRPEGAFGLAPPGADASASFGLDVRAHPTIAESRMKPS
jgi:hypothetical protein